MQSRRFILANPNPDHEMLSQSIQRKRAYSIGDDFLNQRWSLEVYGHRKA